MPSDQDIKDLVAFKGQLFRSFYRKRKRNIDAVPIRQSPLPEVVEKNVSQGVIEEETTTRSVRANEEQQIELGHPVARSNDDFINPSFPLSPHVETWTSEQRESLGTGNDAGSTTPTNSSLEQQIRSSILSLVVIYCILVALTTVLGKTGLNILDPPEELTKEVPDRDVSDGKIHFDSVFWKLFILFVLTLLRVEFSSRLLQAAVSVVHVILLSAIWYSWSSNTPPGRSAYGTFLTIEK